MSQIFASRSYRTSIFCGTASDSSRSPCKRQNAGCKGEARPQTGQSLSHSRFRSLPVDCQSFTRRELRVACNGSGQAVKQTLPPGDLKPSTVEDLSVASHENRLHESGPLYKRGTPGKEVAVVTEPEIVQALLSADYHTFQNDWGQGVSDLLGPGAIANRHGEAHKASRRALTKGFSRDAVLTYLPDVVKLAAHFLATWSRQDSVPLLAELKCFTFDISCSLIMGFNVEEKERRDLRRDFTTLTMGLSAIPFDRSNLTAAAALDARTRLLDRIQPRILMAHPDSTPSNVSHGKPARPESPQPTPFQRLKAAAETEGEDLPLEELLDQSINLLMASTETTAFSMCNMMLELASQPAIAQKLADEQEVLISRHGTDISGTVLDDMAYGEAVARETLRVHSPVPFVYRRALVDLELGSYTIPKGWIVQLALQQQDPEPHMAPEQPGFCPERWLDREGNLIEQPRSFMPFGGGPRLCLGWMLAKMEMKVMLALLVRSFRCNQPFQQQTLPANVPANDDAIYMKFFPKSSS